MAARSACFRPSRASGCNTTGPCQIGEPGPTMDSCKETYDVMVVLDQAQAHRELLAGTLACWRCCAPLRCWGHARARSLPLSCGALRLSWTTTCPLPLLLDHRGPPAGVRPTPERLRDGDRRAGVTEQRPGRQSPHHRNRPWAARRHRAGLDPQAHRSSRVATHHRHGRVPHVQREPSRPASNPGPVTAR